jgi:hypothetical protein
MVATRHVNHKAPPTPGRDPSRVTHQIAGEKDEFYTCLMVDNATDPNAFTCHTYDEWLRLHFGVINYDKRQKCLQCKAGHMSNNPVIKAKPYSWASLQPKQEKSEDIDDVPSNQEKVTPSVRTSRRNVMNNAEPAPTQDITPVAETETVTEVPPEGKIFF